jgi:hypothetical protein
MVMILAFSQGMGAPPTKVSVTHDLRICVNYVVRIFCKLCPGLVQRNGGRVTSTSEMWTRYPRSLETLDGYQ